MQSIFGSVPVAGLEAALKPWQKIDWCPETERRIYRSWADYYTRRRRENSALFYYNKALNIEERDFMTLYHRSQSKRKAAKTVEALQDGRAAAALGVEYNHGQQVSTINLEVCDTLYELNQFENSLAELHDNTGYFTGNRIKVFKTRHSVVNENMKDALHESLGPFFFENEALITQIVEKIKAESNIDLRPLWKILKDKGLCDVVSVLEQKEVLLSPLEEARRKRAFDVFNQSYIYRPWIDVLFLKNLRQNPSLLLNMCPESTPYIKKLLYSQYDVVIKFLEMLHARAPMYYLRDTTFQNKHMFKKYREDFLYRTQYQTRRNMISVLRSIRFLRKNGNLRKLAKYVEEVMGDYVTIKTHRIMTWKFEFLNEVYNTLALAYAESYRVSVITKSCDQFSLLHLLHLPLNKTMDVNAFVFGDRSTHQQADISDPKQNFSRQYIGRLEKRLIFSKYSIEKSYLYHQIAQIHLNQNHYDECCFNARKAIEEAKNCNSKIWNFLSNLLIVKSHAALQKVERCKEALESALHVTFDLKCPELTLFIETCLYCNMEEMTRKATKSNQSIIRHSTISLTQLSNSDI